MRGARRASGSCCMPGVMGGCEQAGGRMEGSSSVVLKLPAFAARSSPEGEALGRSSGAVAARRIPGALSAVGAMLWVVALVAASHFVDRGLGGGCLLVHCVHSTCMLLIICAEWCFSHGAEVHKACDVRCWTWTVTHMYCTCIVRGAGILHDMRRGTVHCPGGTQVAACGIVNKANNVLYRPVLDFRHNRQDCAADVR